MKRNILQFWIATSCLLTITSMLNAQRISAGASHSIIVCADGSVQVFGSNSYGQIGLGEDVEEALTPTILPGMSNVVAAAACGDHSLFVKDDGTVWATGDNEEGQLGDSTYERTYTPIQVPGISNAVAVAGVYQSLVLLADSTVMAFGENSGECGLGFDGDVFTATLIPNLDDVVAIAAGYYKSFALKSDGTVWVFGDNFQNFIGLGEDADEEILVPTQIPELNDIIAIDGGYWISAALQSNGDLWVWGRNSSAELGIGDSINHYSPIVHPLLSNIVSMGVGLNFGFAVNNDGLAQCWGQNTYGQLGTGNSDNQPIPTNVIGMNNVNEVIVGHDSHCLFLNNDGTLWASGNGAVGQPSNGPFNTPVIIEGVCTVTTISEDETVASPMIYPNPFQDNIRITHAEDVNGYSVYNSTGQLILSQRNYTAAPSIDTSLWPKGIYILQLQSSTGMVSHKMLKQ